MDPYPDLHSLTQAIRRGEEAAFSRFHDLYSFRIYKRLLVLTRGDEGTAREICQAVVVKLARRFEVFHEETALWAWRVERRAIRLAAACAGLAVLGVGVWLAPPSAPAPQPALASAEPKSVPVPKRPATPSKIKYINDQELLAFFKDRSCVLAEINGKKQLVFLDDDPGN